MYSKLLVAIDASEASKLALEEAIKLAQGLRASIRLLHVVDTWSLLTAGAAVVSYDTILEIMRGDGAQLLRDAAATVSRAHVNVETNLVETSDIQVGECIVRKARECEVDLIICGTHGRRGMRRLLVGSDAEYIVRHCPVPVLLVRTPEAVRANTLVAGGAAA
jgi:nucleotide-binding universal stress UspA family protein